MVFNDSFIDSCGTAGVPKRPSAICLKVYVHVFARSNLLIVYVQYTYSTTYLVFSNAPFGGESPKQCGLIILAYHLIV